MKGTASRGRNNKQASHITCRRCGKHARHKSTGICASCGYGKSARIRSYTWQKK